MNVILYSTGCPRCNVLKKKLIAKNITFEEVTDHDILFAKGYIELPVLEADGTVMEFKAANDWINTL